MLLRLSFLILVLLSYASSALAAWGENWGTMVWGAAAPPAAVPMTGWLGLGLLLAVLLMTALWKMNRVPGRVGLTLSLFLLVPVLIAPHITTWNGLTWYTFINGEVADAGEVNQNFSALTDALDVTVPNSFANSGIADANEINSNFDTLKTAVDTFTNDLAAATSATETAAAAATTAAEQASTDNLQKLYDVCGWLSDWYWARYPQFGVGHNAVEHTKCYSAGLDRMKNEDFATASADLDGLLVCIQDDLDGDGPYWFSSC